MLCSLLVKVISKVGRSREGCLTEIGKKDG